jgi:DNA-binding transcriptional MerR regulator
MGTIGIEQGGVDLDINDLCRLTGVTQRTVRYYIQTGLLPAPGQTGPGPKYGNGHLNRLRMIRRLQREHLPLAEIRARLERMSDAEVAKSVAAAGKDSGRQQRVAQRVATRLQPRSLPRETERSQWERVTLAEDVELHVRRPLTRHQNRRVEQLLEAARKIFAEE